MRGSHRTSFGKLVRGGISTVLGMGVGLGLAFAAPHAEEGAPSASSAIADAVADASDAAADTSGVGPSEPPARVEAPRISKGVEEIVVTGRKREEVIQETPISMVAFTDEDLEIKSVTEVAEIGQNVAGLKFDTTTGSNNQARVYIRGVGQDNASSEVDPGVGIYVDGVYYPRALGSTFSLVDIDRIEVLRGPQGTLYGKNTIGGLINVITRKPDEEFGGRLQVRAGNYGVFETRTSIDVPLVPERVYSRVSIATATGDGYLDNALNDDNLGDNKLLSGRLALRLLPVDDVEANFTYDRSQENEKAPVGECRRVTDLALSTFIIDNTSRFREGCNESESGDEFSVFANEPTKTDIDIQGTTGIVSWDVGPFTLKSTSAWRQVKTRGRGGDIDGTRVEFVGSATGGKSKNDVISQELLLQARALDNKLFVSTGFYGLKEQGHGKGSATVQRNLIFDPSTPIVGVPGFTFAALEDIVQTGAVANARDDIAVARGFDSFAQLMDADAAQAMEVGTLAEQQTLSLGETLRNLNRLSRTRFETLSYAAFGEASYDVTEKLSLTLGMRATHERKERQGRSFAQFPFDKPASADRLGVGINRRFRDLSGRSIVNYKWNDDIFTYASFSRGFRSGGFNETTVLAADAGSVEPFDDERLESLELGIKTTWLDNRLLFNLTGFYNRYDKVQLTTLTVGENGLGSSSVQNAGDAIVQGLEMDFQARPGGFLSNFSFNGGVSFINADYESFRTDVVDDFDSDICPSLRLSECSNDDPDDNGPNGENGPLTSPFAQVLTALANPGPRTRLGVDVSDRDFKQTPPFSFNVGVTHNLEAGDWGSFISNVSWYHQGKTFQNTANSKSVQQPKFGLLSARVAWQLWDGKTSIAFFGRNLLDRRYIVGALDLRQVTGTNQAFFAPPRTYGIEIIRRFGGN